MRDRYGRAPRSQSHPPSGLWNGACTQGSLRNLGWSLGALVEDKNGNGKGNRAGRASRGRSAQYEL
jgi:hypothetical protein